MQQLSLEYIERQFEQSGCKLLTKEYINSETRLSYICSCGNTSTISYSNFKQGHRCKNCGFKKSISKRRRSLKTVQDFFTKAGCTLLATEYINNHIPLNYICNCGKKAIISFMNFKLGQRCYQCGIEKRGKSNSYDFSFVKKYFHKQHCKLLSREYINGSTPLSYVCQCGKHAKISFYSFLRGSRCFRCGVDKRTLKNRTTIKIVSDFFKKQKCRLLATEYVNGHVLMPYVCSCGNNSMIRFNDFKRGHRCMKCSGNEKYGIEFVRHFFQKRHCVLLSKTYHNCTSYLRYVCDKNKKHSVRFGDFIRGLRCSCRKSNRLSIKSVRRIFRENGCILLSNQYQNARKPLSYVCSCGNKSMICLGNLRMGSRCMKCSFQRARNTRKKTKHTWQEINIHHLQKSIKERRKQLASV